MWREKEREDSLCRAAGFGPSFVFSALVTGHARIHSSTSPLWIQSFDHVADRGHLRRALEKVNYAGGTRPLSISKEMVERNDCEFQITDSPRYPSVLSSFRRPIRRLWKIEISKGKELFSMRRSRNNYCRGKITFGEIQKSIGVLWLY